MAMAIPTTGRPLFGLVLMLLLAAGVVHAASVQPPELAGDVANPHRGFMLWGTDFADGAAANYYGARIFHIYVPWREVETAPGVFAWAQMEANHLQPILAVYPDATFVLRLLADYPDGPDSNIDLFYERDGQGAVIDPHRDFPAFLLAPPFSLTALPYVEGGSCGLYGSGVMLPWNDPLLIERMELLIAAFGARYDGHPRISAVQFGLLGYWGEWHTHGCTVHALGTTVRSRLAQAFIAAFPATPLQTRYAQEPDASDPVGFHEDYFPSFTVRCNDWPTVPLCDDGGTHNLDEGFRRVPRMAGYWRQHPIGGESPMPAQKQFWHSAPAVVADIVRAYHFSILGPAGGHQSAGQQAAMSTIGRALGYRLVVAQARWSSHVSATAPLHLALVVGNRGSAPLYHPFALHVHWLHATQPQVLASTPLPWALHTLEDDAGDISWSTLVDTPAALSPGHYRLALAADNDGLRLRFANQGLDADGRLLLGAVTLHADLLFADDFE